MNALKFAIVFSKLSMKNFKLRFSPFAANINAADLLTTTIRIALVNRIRRVHILIICESIEFAPLIPNTNEWKFVYRVFSLLEIISRIYLEVLCVVSTTLCVCVSCCWRRKRSNSLYFLFHAILSFLGVPKCNLQFAIQSTNFLLYWI